MKTNTPFAKIKVGDMFHCGKSKGIGIRQDVTMFVVYQKITKSSAIVVDQVGFSNKRMVGTTNKFSANNVVFLFNGDYHV